MQTPGPLPRAEDVTHNSTQARLEKFKLTALAKSRPAVKYYLA
jgi:hypothetical protein